MTPLSADGCSQALRHGLIPAVPVPFRASGEVDLDEQDRYIARMAAQPIAGVAVWAHTGRGLHLSAPVRNQVLEAWRRGLDANKLIIAGAGASSEQATDPQRYIASALRMADDALHRGADALLAYSPTAFRYSPQRDQLILDYHRQLAQRGAPLILFYLYEAAGGISYSRDLLRELFALPQVAGIKIATLDSVMTFQDIAALIQTEFPHQLLITGEDRFLGYSLMCGAQAALIGMGAVCTQLQWDLMDSWFHCRSAEFLSLSRAVDVLSQALFVAPMEGYIRRVLEALACEGWISRESTHDPWGPALPSSDLDQVRTIVRSLAHPSEQTER